MKITPEVLESQKRFRTITNPDGVAVQINFLGLVEEEISQETTDADHDTSAYSAYPKEVVPLYKEISSIQRQLEDEDEENADNIFDEKGYKFFKTSFGIGFETPTHLYLHTSIGHNHDYKLWRKI